MQANRWIEEDPTRAELVQQMTDVFEDVRAGRSKNFFVPRIYANYMQYGQLTPKQEAALRASLAKEQANAMPGGVGKVGERVDLALTLLGVETVNTDFGVRYIHRFADDDGNAVVWKGTSRLEAEDNAKLAIRATVKAHRKERDGQAVTDISHAKLAEEPKAAQIDVRAELKRLADLIEPIARALA